MIMQQFKNHSTTDTNELHKTATGKAPLSTCGEGPGVRLRTWAAVILIFFFGGANAQSPGGITVGLTAWFMANNNNFTMNGANVATWTSQVNGYAATQATASKQPLLVTTPNANNSFNFNPSVQFQSSLGKSLNNISATPDLLGTNGTVFMVTNTFNYASNSSSAFAYTSNSTNRYQIKAHFRIQTGNNGTGYTADFNPQFPAEYNDAAGRLLASRSTGTDFYSKRNGEKFTINNAEPLYNPSVSTGLCIGSNNNGGGTEYTNSAIAELITFNFTLSDVDINRVESYLAIKYGITLQSAAGPINYVSSNGSIIWNAAANIGYNTNITGIGRDDGSSLKQKQSRSVNKKGLVSLYYEALPVFPNMNDDNTSTFNSDQNFVMFGDNDLDTALTVCIQNNTMQRMPRIWKVQRTANNPGFKVVVNTIEVPAGVKYIVVSNTPAFTPGAFTNVYPLQTLGGKLYYAGGINSGSFFSFASDSIRASFTVTQPNCTTPTGTIAAVATGGVGAQTYTWNTLPVQNGATVAGLSPGSYTFTTTSPAGCSVIFPAGNIVAAPSINLSVSANPVSICKGDTSILTATASGGNGNLTYNWVPGNVTTSAISVWPTDTTKYYITIQSGACSRVDSITINVKPLPTSTFIAAPAAVCLGANNTITYTGTASTSATYNWNFDGAAVQSGTGSGPYSLLFPTAGTKNILLSVTENGCTSATLTSQTVLVDQPATTTFTALPATICAGETVGVAYTGTAAANAVFAWNWGGGTVTSGTTGSGPFAVTYNTSGNIVLTITNGACTTISQAKNIAVTPMPIASFDADAVTGCDPLTVNFTNTSQNASSYIWDLGDGNTSTSSTTFSNSYPTGTYQVTLIARDGLCADTTAGTIIDVSAKPVAAFISNPYISTPVQLSQAIFAFTNQSLNATNYTWAFGDNQVSGTTDPSHKYLLPGNYTVTLYARNTLGCVDSISKFPYMVVADSLLRIPNVFSPNGDGINDTWEIRGLLGYPQSHIEIFNRWGQRIFSSTGYNNPWNGKYNNQPLPVGTYYYTIFANDKKYSGGVTLLR